MPDEGETLLDVRQAAVLLHVRPCTVRNERIRGKLGYFRVGAKIFYAQSQIAEYLESQRVTACVVVQENPSPARSATFGSAKIATVPEPKTLGAAPGTIDQAARLAVLALAQQTFTRQASSSRTGSWKMAKAKPM
jgi:hypothetical protein